MNRHLIPLQVILILCASASSSAGNTFIVNTASDTYDGVCDANCSLKDAIFAAENTPGADDVVLQNCATYTLSTPYDGTIADQTRIIGNGAVIERDVNAAGFRFFDVVNSGSLELESLTLRGGSTQSNGGGAIWNRGGTVSAENCSFDDNHAVGTSGAIPGGAIYNDGHFGGAGVFLERCSFRNNSAVTGGALTSDGFSSSVATVYVSRCFFGGNSALNYIATAYGGAIFLRGENDALISNTTISGNSSQTRGGGIAFHSLAAPHTARLRNVTVTGNTAQDGGGLFQTTCGPTCPDPSYPIVENTIDANNSAPSGADWSGTYISGGHNVRGPGNGSFATTTGDQTVATLANLGPLSDNGASGGQYRAPLAGCVAIDAGDNGLATPTDQLGFDRRGPACDVGAIEYRPCLPPPSDLADFWRFNELIGNNANDVVGAGNDGTHQNGPVPTPGMSHGSLCFNGIDQWVRVDDHNEVDFLGDCSLGSAEPFTIDCWVKTCRTGIQPIVEKRDPFIGRGYAMYISNGQLGFHMETNPGVSNDYLSGAPVPGGVDLRDDRWHFVAVTVTRCTTAAGKFYIDGNLISTFTPLTGNLTNNLDLGIGIGISALPFYFHGCLDELEIFKRDLTAAEVTALYSAGWAGKCHNFDTDVPGTTGTDAIAWVRLRNNPLMASSATIDFWLPAPDHVLITVSDVSGRRVRSLIDRGYEAGNHLVDWDGRDDQRRPLPRGLYLVVVQIRGQHVREALKVALLK